MRLSKKETDFLKALEAGLADRQAELEQADYGSLFRMAGEQKLLPFVYEALRQSRAAEENSELFAAAKAQVRRQVLNQTLRSAAFRELYGQMRKAGLHPVVVKGQLCSSLYPKEDFRLSGDDDLWVAEEEMDGVHNVLTARGLVTQVPEEERATREEITYRDPGGPLYLEVHRQLFRGESPWNDSFSRGLRNPVEIQGFLSLPPQDHLLYLILHSCKHFVARGVGIRQFCDMGLWAQAYGDRLDWEKLYEDCKAFHCQGFASGAFGVCRSYLGLSLTLPDCWKETAPPEPLCHDALAGGIYGSAQGDRLRASTLTLHAVQSGDGGRKLPLSTLFPPGSYLRDQYPYLRRHPGLLPWAWVQRLFRYAAEDRKGNSPVGAMKLARERVALLRQYGILEE